MTFLVVDHGRAHGTVLNVVNLLHAILNEALRDGLVPVNAAAQARRPPSPRANKKIRFLAPEEVDALVRAAPSDDMGSVETDLYYVAAWTGLRQGELLALRWRNVDFSAMLIRVHESWSDGRLTDPKSFGSLRYVPMTEDVARRLARQANRAWYTGDDDLVFGHPHKGSHMSATTVIDRFKKALKAAGLRPDVRFHDLRHTFGTQMAAGGVHLRTVQAWMGHANIQTTEIYAQYAPDPTFGRDVAQRAFEAVTRAVSETSSGLSPRSEVSYRGS